MDWVRIGNWTLDRVLRIGADEILNSGAAGEPPEDVCRKLMQTAKGMKAIALEDEDGGLDYARLAAHELYSEHRRLTQVLRSYSPLEEEHRDGQLAFWINLYNALIMDAVISYRVSASLQSHFSLFRRAAYEVAGLRFSPEDIEHGVLRGNGRHPFLPLRQFWRGDPREAFVIDPPDPRIHFALNCAARSCPPLAFYGREGINEQLDLATANFLNSGGTRYEPGSNTLWLSKILDWYGEDFGGADGVLEFIWDYLEDEEARRAIEDSDIQVRHMPYDWDLAGLPRARVA